MKTTVVPAQVTTVEDKIAGKLGLHQLLLLVTPLILASLLYAGMPPFFGYSMYKIVAASFVMTLGGLLAVRIKDQIVLQWCAMIGRYLMRPRYYVYTKNDAVFRGSIKQKYPKVTKILAGAVDDTPRQIHRLKIAERLTVENFLNQGIAPIRYTVTKQGGLHAVIQEAQQKT